ncbi:MAG: Essential protein Yae1, N terminal [Thelocarpon impressellum]|nr:MAG: Essential protein Yae1, N terminal [Thelocarpon impressellum]
MAPSAPPAHRSPSPASSSTHRKPIAPPSPSNTRPRSPKPSAEAGGDEDGEEVDEENREELISTLPSLRKAHETLGYRDGITASKASSVQAGFDEGYALGAARGLRAGCLLGALEGLRSARVGEARRELGVEAGGGEVRRWEGIVRAEGKGRGLELELELELELQPELGLDLDLDLGRRD